jgi:hypothetical protein
MTTNRIRCSALVVKIGLEEMRWIPCALDGCGFTTSEERRMRFVVLYCTPDDGHNDA